jgi:hypothetical protein
MAGKAKDAVLGIALGTAVGAVAGVLAGHVAIWLAFGIAIGIRNRHDAATNRLRNLRSRKTKSETEN